MSVDTLAVTLKSLKLYGMAHAVDDLSEQHGPAFTQARPILEDLIKAEVAEREVRSVNDQLKGARFPAHRDLAGFRFEHSDVDATLVNTLRECQFLRSAHNVVFVGGPGTGKTHLATAIGIQAVMHHRLRVRFFSTPPCVDERGAPAAGPLGRGGGPKVRSSSSGWPRKPALGVHRDPGGLEQPGHAGGVGTIRRILLKNGLEPSRERPPADTLVIIPGGAAGAPWWRQIS